MKKILSILMLLVLLISMLSGCGAGGSKGVKVIDIKLTNESYAFGVDKNKPELLDQVNSYIAQIFSDGTFDKICSHYFGSEEPVGVTSASLDSSKDQLIVATNATFPPFEYTEGNKFYGIDMEIAAAFAESLGKELVIQDMAFESVCLSVGQSKCDIAMAGLTVNEKRKEHVAFSDPYYDASQIIITRADDTRFDSCSTPEDAEAVLAQWPASAKIGVQNGTTAYYYVNGDEEWGFDGYTATCMGYDAGALAVQDLMNGTLDCVILDEAPAKSIAASFNK